MATTTKQEKRFTLVMAPAAYNLAETSRCVEVAKACRDDFHIQFASYGGEFETLITDAGFKLQQLEPQLTPEKIDHLYRVDQGQSFGAFFTRQEVEAQVRSELEFYKSVKPVAVVTGFVFSNNISCRVLHIPLVWMSQSTWNFTSMLQEGIGTYPDMMDVVPLKWLPERTVVKISVWMMKLFSLVFRPFNQVAQEQYGLSPIRDIERWWEGDYNLLPEPPGFCPPNLASKLPCTYHLVGPLIARLNDRPIPDSVLNIPRGDGKPIVYFAMGSSGQPEVIASIVEGFAGKPYHVIAPVKDLLDKLQKKQNRPIFIPENVVVTGWLPAHIVNPMANISVIHGGIGTTFTACLAGKPVVGVGMMIEQESNIDCLVRLGFAQRIRKHQLTPERLCNAIDALLQDDTAKQKAVEFQKVTEEWTRDNPSHIAHFFQKTFLEGIDKE